MSPRWIASIAVVLAGAGCGDPALNSGDGGGGDGGEADLAPVDLAPSREDLRLPDPDLAPRPFCNDQIRNGQESDVDCGGPTCARCPDKRACQKDGDCLTFKCVNLKCVGGTAPKLAFKMGAVVPILAATSALATADLDRDGALDLLLLNTGASNNFMVALGRGDGTFRNHVTYVPMGRLGDDVVIADFDKTGTLDLALPEADTGNVSVFLGKGDGTFKVHGSFPTQRKSGSTLAAGDINRDGWPDLISGGGDDHMGFLPGAPGARYDADGRLGSGDYGAVACADFNRDGFDDVAAGGKQLSVFFADGKGYFVEPPTILPVGMEPYEILAADLNRDGRPDLVTFDRLSHTIGTALSLPTGFTRASEYFFPSVFFQGLAGDLDGDGTIDIAFTGSGLGLQVITSFGDGWGPGAFRASGSLGQMVLSALVAGDFDRDGDLDIAVSSTIGIQILLNTSK